MYKNLSLLIFTYWLMACEQRNSTHKANIEKVNNVQTKTEDLEDFLKKFSSNKEFQLSRIQFPLKNKVYNIDTGQLEVLFILKADWKFSDFNNKLYSKKVKKENAKKFILNIQIAETGVYVDYIFELINGEWSLTTIMDEST